MSEGINLKIQYSSKNPKYITFAYFFILTTLFSKNYCDQGYLSCLQTHTSQLDTPTTQHNIFVPP